jgi:predicted PurR-regulated permease PerM
MNGSETRLGFRNRGRLFLLLALLGSLYLAYRILRPYLNPIVLAVLIGSLFHPLFRSLRRRFRGRAALAATATCALVVLLVLGPATMFITALVNQGTYSVQAIQSWVAAGQLQQLLQKPWVQRGRELAAARFPQLDLTRFDLQGSILSISRALGQFLLVRGGAILSGAGGLLGDFLLMVFVMFYVLQDGERLLAAVRHLLPLPTSQEQQLVERIRSVSRSALLGTFLTAAAQGVAGGIGLWIAGIPALFWGAMMAFTSLIPVVGTLLIWGPAAVYLLLAGHGGRALFLTLWCMVFVGSIDNFVRPLLMRGQARMSTLWIFLSILGGINLFGLLGFIYGPLVFGLCSVLLFLYEQEFAEYLERQDAG